TGNYIYLFHAQGIFLHQFKNSHNAENPDAICYKGRCVFAFYSSFTQEEVAVMQKKIHYIFSGFGRRNNFQQFKITRGVKKMGAAKMCRKIFTSPFQHHFYRNAGSICSDKASGLSVLFYLFKERLLDIQSFHHRLNNPVAITDAEKIIFEIACLYRRCESSTVQRRRIAFYGML